MFGKGRIGQDNSVEAPNQLQPSIPATKPKKNLAKVVGLLVAGRPSKNARHHGVEDPDPDGLDSSFLRTQRRVQATGKSA